MGYPRSMMASNPQAIMRGGMTHDTTKRQRRAMRQQQTLSRLTPASPTRQVENCPGGVICGWESGTPICSASVSGCDAAMRGTTTGTTFPTKNPSARAKVTAQMTPGSGTKNRVKSKTSTRGGLGRRCSPFGARCPRPLVCDPSGYCVARLGSAEPSAGMGVQTLDQRQLSVVRSVLKGKRVRGVTQAQRDAVRQAAKGVRASCKSRPELLDCPPGQSPIYIAAWHAYCCAGGGPIR